MKKLSLAVLFVSLVTLTFAADLNNYLSASNQTQKSITVNYSYFEPIKTSLTISNESGDVLYKETSKNPAEMQSFFLVDKLNDGNFFVRIENQNQLVETGFVIEAGTVTVNESNKFFKPTMNQESESVVINLLNPDQNEVTINVYNDKGQPLMTLTDNKTFIGKKLNFESLVGEDVLIAIEQGNITTTESFRIK